MSVNMLIAFYSRNGSTEALARAIAQGAQSEGAKVRLRRAREVVSEEVMAQAEGWRENAERMNGLYEAPTAADAEWADAVVFGSPTRFGNVSSELKAYIDSLGGLWMQGKLVDKAGAAFTSTSTPHGGNESTVLSMYNFMAHLGMPIRHCSAPGRPMGLRRCPARTTSRRPRRISRSRASREPGSRAWRRH